MTWRDHHDYPPKPVSPWLLVTLGLVFAGLSYFAWQEIADTYRWWKEEVRGEERIPLRPRWSPPEQRPGR